MTRQQYVVITQQVEGSARLGFSTACYSDLKLFDDRDRAIRHGFTLGRSDDFNVGTVQGGRMVAFGWMDQDFADGSGYDLEEIGQQIYLPEATRR